MKRTILSVFLFIFLLFLTMGCEDNPSSEPPRAEYTVTFYSDASNVFQTVKVKEGEKVTKPESEPSILGRGKLKAWVTDLNDEEGTVYDFSKEVTGNINLYASYHELKTVTLYKSDGTTKLRDVYVSYSSPLEKPSDEYIDDCLIKRWVTMEGSEYDFSTPVTVDLKLKAECYEKAETDKKEALAYMKIKDALLSTTEEKSEETIKGFEKETLAAIYLFWSVRTQQNIDIEKNIYPYWTIDGTNYYLYRKGMDSLELPTFLYYEIGDDFSCSFYPPTITEEETVIEIDSFKLPITFYKGKYNPETDKVEKADGASGSKETIQIDKIKIVKKADGSSSMTIITNDYSVEYTEKNEKKDKAVERTIVLKKNGKEYGMTFYFPSITFDAENGEKAVVCEVLSGTAVSKPSNIPSTHSGYKLFKEWTLGGKAWDFSTPVTENITLKATYWTETEYKKIVEAVCINNITNNLSMCDKFMSGEQSNARAFMDDESVRPYLSYSLLSALFQLDENFDLYVINNGTKYYYTKETQDTYVVYPIIDGINVSKNQSNKQNGISYVKCDSMALKASYSIKDKRTELGTLSASFNIDGKIETKSDGSVVTTTSFSSGGTNYPTLTTTKTTLSNGRTQIKYEYGEMTFYRVF